MRTETEKVGLAMDLVPVAVLRVVREQRGLFCDQDALPDPCSRSSMEELSGAVCVVLLLLDILSQSENEFGYLRRVC